MTEKIKITNLTFREQEVSNLLKLGCSNMDISKKLGIAINTVKIHLVNIYNKIEVTNRTEAVTVLNEIESDKIESDKINDFYIVPRLVVKLSCNRDNSQVNQLISALNDRLNLFETVHIYENLYEHSLKIEDSSGDGEDDFLLTADLNKNSSEIVFSLKHLLNDNFEWYRVIKIVEQGKISESFNDIIDNLAVSIHMQIEGVSADKFLNLFHNDAALIPFNCWNIVMGMEYFFDNSSNDKLDTFIDFFSRAQKCSPDNEWILHGIGAFWFKVLSKNLDSPLNAHDELYSIARKSMQIAPMSQHSYMNMAYISVVENNIQTGIKYLKKVIHYNSCNYRAYLLLLQIYHVLGDNEKSDAVINRLEILGLDHLKFLSSIKL